MLSDTNPIPDTNPLSEAKLEEIFSSDPKTRTDEELLSIVQYYRNLRLSWEKAEKEKPIKTKKPAAPKLKPAKKELSLEDLGLVLGTK